MSKIWIKITVNKGILGLEWDKQAKQILLWPAVLFICLKLAHQQKRLATLALYHDPKPRPAIQSHFTTNYEVKVNNLSKNSKFEEKKPISRFCERGRKNDNFVYKLDPHFSVWMTNIIDINCLPHKIDSVLHNSPFQGT